MKQENIVAEKSYGFALRIIKLYNHLLENQKPLKLADQVLKSGTSIGANVEEAIGASSIKDFKAKMDISYKEARETKYWLRLLKDSNMLESKVAASLMQDCEELLKIIGTIIKTIKIQNRTSNPLINNINKS